MHTFVELKSDDDPLFEIIDGRKLDVPSLGMFGGQVAARTGAALRAYCESKGIVGEVVIEGLFKMGPSLCRRPDVAFIAGERIPPGSDPRDDWPAAPNLAAEIIMDWKAARAIHPKVVEYLSHGVEEVWIIELERRSVKRMPGLRVEQAGQLVPVVETFAYEGVVASPVLPGFWVDVAKLFP